jgi:hypothetical protein
MHIKDVKMGSWTFKYIYTHTHTLTYIYIICVCVCVCVCVCLRQNGVTDDIWCFIIIIILMFFYYYCDVWHQAEMHIMDVKMGSRTFIESECTNKNKRMDLLQKMVKTKKVFYFHVHSMHTSIHTLPHTHTNSHAATRTPYTLWADTQAINKTHQKTICCQ